MASFLVISLGPSDSLIRSCPLRVSRAGEAGASGCDVAMACARLIGSDPEGVECPVAETEAESRPLTERSGALAFCW